MHERSIRGCLAVRRGALRRTGQSRHLRLGDRDGLGLPVRIDAPIGAEKPIPEIVDYRKIAIGMPVVEKMELLLSPEPRKSPQPRSRHVVVFIKIEGEHRTRSTSRLVER